MPAYTLTLSISSDSASEIAETVEALGRSVASLDRAGGKIATNLTRDGSSDGLDRISWYQLHARRFLDELTPDATRAVMYVADHAPAVGIRAMSDALGLGTGPALAGKLASIGWAVRRLGAPAPFQRIRDRYEIDPDVAAALRAASLGTAAGPTESRATEPRKVSPPRRGSRSYEPVARVATGTRSARRR